METHARLDNKYVNNKSSIIHLPCNLYSIANLVGGNWCPFSLRLTQKNYQVETHALILDRLYVKNKRSLLSISSFKARLCYKFNTDLQVLFSFKYFIDADLHPIFPLLSLQYGFLNLTVEKELILNFSFSGAKEFQLPSRWLRWRRPALLFRCPVCFAKVRPERIFPRAL